MHGRGNNPVVVVRARQSGKRAEYESKAGDLRRQGRVISPAEGQGPVSIVFVETSAAIEARLGRVCVGYVTHDVTNNEFMWSLRLPQMEAKPKSARTEGKAKDALAHKIREWCEAASLISTRRKYVP